MDELRPALRCLVAWPLADGHVYRPPRVVTLERAASLKDDGWLIVGPDPSDQVALASWERAQSLLKRFEKTDGRGDVAGL